MNGAHDTTETTMTRQSFPSGSAQPYAGPNAPPRLVSPDPRTKSPALACVLSAMPGLGQVYVGYYQRGFIHILIAGAVIALLAAEATGPLLPLAGMFLAFFWLYNIIDAGRRAALYNQLLAGSETIELPRDFGKPSVAGALFGGLALIVFGAVVLLHTQWGMPLDWIKDWWPLAPMGLGVYLLARAFQERAAKRSA